MQCEGVCSMAGLRAFARADDGVALVEYALIAALLAMAMITMLALIQTETGAQLTATGTGLSNVGITPP